MPSYLIGDSIYFEVSDDGKIVTLKVGSSARAPTPRDVRILALLCRGAPDAAAYAAIAEEAIGARDCSRQAIATGVNELKKQLKPDPDDERACDDAKDGVVENIRNAGYRLRLPVRRLDAPAATTIAIGAFEAPQNEAAATAHALALSEHVKGAFINDDAAARRFLPDAGRADFTLDFTFVMLGATAMLSMTMRRRADQTPLCHHTFDDIKITDKLDHAALLERIVSHVDAEILRDKWRRASAGSSDWNEHDVEALLTPLYAIVESEGDDLKRLEALLKSLRAGGPRVAQAASATLSLLYGLQARQAIDPTVADARKHEALSCAKEAMTLHAPPHVLAELALARAQRMAQPASAEDQEALLSALARICERIPGNVLARTTYASALLDDPSRADQAQTELARLETLYPHKAARSMALTVIAKAHALRHDVGAAQHALETAVQLAEETSKARRAPPFLRYALAVFHNSAARLADGAAAHEAAENHRAKARAAMEAFTRENKEELAKSAFDGREFLLRQLDPAPGWLRDHILAAADELIADV